MLRRSALAFSLFTLPACPADDEATGGGTTETDASDTSGSASGTMTAATMSTSGSMTSTTDSTTNSTTTTNDTTDSGDTMDSTSSSGSSSSSSGAPESTYPACDPRMDPPCPEGYDTCYDAIPGYNVCNVVGCETPDDCPLANGGDAEVLCIPFRGGTCVLDCPGDLACPEGMECVELPGAGVERCLWPL